MDILKELFGTSDELQISKSLFGGDGGSGSEELGLDHDQPPVSPSRDYLSSRPLPLLPAEPRPQTAATSSLIRSQSLDDLHAPPSNDVDNLFRPDVLRAQSVFPQLSETGTSNHVNLHDVPHEMPMYLLEEDEGNDEEIMRLLETTAESTPNHSGTSRDHSGTSRDHSGSSSGSDTTIPNGIGDELAIEKVAMEIVAMEMDELPGVVVEMEEAGSVGVVEDVESYVGVSVEVSEDDQLPSNHQTDVVSHSESNTAVITSSLSPSLSSPPLAAATAAPISSSLHPLSPHPSLTTPSSSTSSSPPSTKTPSPETQPLTLSPSSVTSVPISLPSPTNSAASKNSPVISSPSVVITTASDIITSTTITETRDITVATSKIVSAVTTAMNPITMETSGITTPMNRPNPVTSTGQTHLPTVSKQSSSISSPLLHLPTRSTATRPTSIFPTLPAAMTTRETNIHFHSNQTRGQSLSPPRSVVRPKPPLPPSLPLSPPLLSLPTSSIPPFQATPTATPPLTSIQQSIDNLRAQVRLQSQRLEQALKSYLPQPPILRSHPPVTPPTASSVTVTTSSSSPPATNNVRSSGGEGVKGGVEKPEKVTESGCGVDALPLETTDKNNSPSSPVSTCSVAIQTGSGDNHCFPVPIATRKATPPQVVEQKTSENSCHDDSIIEKTPVDDVISKTPSTESKTTLDEESLAASCHGNDVTVEMEKTVSVSSALVQDETMATSQSTSTVTMATNIPPSLRLVSPMAPFQSTFSVCVPDMNWRVPPFGSVLGMKALPITILPSSSTSSSSSSSSTSLTHCQKEREPAAAACSGAGETTHPEPQRAKRRRNGGGWPKGKKRKIVDNDVPKPPSTAYSLYLSEQRQKGKFNSMSMSQFSKTIGRMWGQLPAQDKQEYQERAVKDRQRYLNDLKSHLTKKQKENSSCNLESVNNVLNRLVSTAEDNTVLLCHLCKLTFTTLHNKHSHFSSRTHTNSLLKEMNRVMSLQRATPPRNGCQDSLHSMPVSGMESGSGNEVESHGDESGMEHGNETRENGTELKERMEEAGGMGTGRDMESESDLAKCGGVECDTAATAEDGERGQKVGEEECSMDSGNQTAPDSDITELDVPKYDSAIPSGNGATPSCDATLLTNNDDDENLQTDEAVIEGRSPVCSPHSVPNQDQLLVEWTRDYAGMLARFKEHAVAMQPPTPVGTGQTGFLNQFREQEQDLWKQVDSLISCLQSFPPSLPPSIQ